MLSEKLILLFSSTLFVGLVGGLQGQSPSKDVYANMVGDWVGFNDTTLNGVAKHIPVEIVIVRTSDSVRMDYIYARRGQKDFTKVTKYMKLDPKRSEMTLRWESPFGDGDKYKVNNLDSFAKTGLGEFIASGPAVGPNGDRGLFVFDLASDNLSYKWMSEVKGGFATVTTFTLHRSGSTTSNP